jgi:hypothetical protein
VVGAIADTSKQAVNPHTMAELIQQGAVIIEATEDTAATTRCGVTPLRVNFMYGSALCGHACGHKIIAHDDQCKLCVMSIDSQYIFNIQVRKLHHDNYQ